MTDDLVRLILAAIEADEKLAREAADDVQAEEWLDGGKFGESVYPKDVSGYVACGPYDFMSWELRQFIARHDPASVLRRCAADRKLIALHPQDPELGWLCQLCGGEGQNIDCTYPCDTLRVIAESYGVTPGGEDARG